MFFFSRQLPLIVTASLLVLPCWGCALCKKKQVVPESLTTCRELSREGITAMETGELDRAQTLLSEAVTASPSDIDARRNLAEALWQKGAYRDAAVQMEAAVRLDPRHAPTVIRAGEMLLAVGAYERAMQRTEQAILLDSNLAGAWSLRGRLYRQRGELDRALADMQHALRFAPQDTAALLEVAQIQFELGKPQRSLSTLHCLLDTYTPGEEPQQVLWLEGLAYSSLGRHQEAVESLHAATLRGQPRPDLLFQLAQAEQSAGQRDAATNTLRTALALDDDHEPSRVMLAELQQVDDLNAGGIIRR
ncbi:MAG: tetratricopeptide repeat protein [Bythopirellula sp.]|nr:tetratricopeptide repeat protein [Bythopirellula sp.]